MFIAVINDLIFLFLLISALNTSFKTKNAIRAIPMIK